MAGEAHGVGGAPQVGAHERDIGGGDRGVGTGAHRDAEIRAGEGGRVVKAVTDDGDGEALGLESHHLIGFVLGQHITDHARDTDLRSDDIGRGCTVAGEEDRLEAERAEVLNRLRAGRADLVAGGENAADRSVPRDGGNGAALLCLGSGGGDQLGCELQAFGAETIRTTDDHVYAIDDGLGADAGAGGEVVGGQRRFDGLRDCAPDGVLRADLDRGGERQHAFGILSGQHVDCGKGHAALGDGAGLVEHNRGDLFGALEGRRAAQQDAELRTTARGDEQGSGYRESECAGARHDKHGDGRSERFGDRRAGQQPAEEGDDGEHEHDRHEHAGDAVGQALCTGLLCLGLLDEPRDARGGGVGANALGAYG